VHCSCDTTCAVDQPAYTTPTAGYLEKRVLRRHARVLHLWALGVGAVISGDFFGWNFGLASGFGGMLGALIIMTVLYIGLCFSIAEMSPALPHAGGAYSFARTAMGPWGGYITGLAENMEYILTPAVIVVGVGGYLGAIFGTLSVYAPLWWLASYAIFVAFNVVGVEMSFRVSIIITLCALAILVVFYVGAAPLFSLDRWALEGGPWFPKGWAGVLTALPFALWVYLGIEQLPLAAEEAHAPARDMPKGILLGLVTLILCSFLTVILNAGIPPGASQVAKSTEPLFLGFRAIFGQGLRAKLLALFACTGLLASFHTIIYAYGRQIYSLSRAGYFPSWLSVTHGRRQTPHRALIAGSLLGFAAALTIQLAGQNSPVGGVLLNMAVFGAVLAYILQMLSFILLRRKFPEISRPYVSPVGIAGAAIAMIIAAVTLVSLFLNRDYNLGVIGAAVWFLCGIAYFAFYARHRLILSPEEKFALAQQERLERGAAV
jgi:ethanolamine permease